MVNKIKNKDIRLNNGYYWYKVYDTNKLILVKVVNGLIFDDEGKLLGYNDKSIKILLDRFTLMYKL